MLIKLNPMIEPVGTCLRCGGPVMREVKTFDNQRCEVVCAQCGAYLVESATSKDWDENV